VRRLEAFSRFVNCLFGGNEYESISARSYKEGRVFMMKIINALFFWQNNHCRGAYNNGLKRMKEYIKNEGH
jgi:hypothetical protein